MNNMSEIYIDDDCLMCTRFGQKAKNKSKKVTVRSNTELTKDLHELDSIVLVTNGNTYTGHDAIIKIISNWGFFYKSIKIVNLIPKAISNKLYKLLSNHRHKISKFLH